MSKNTKPAGKRSFTGTSQRGDVSEALSNAIREAEQASGIVDALIQWKLDDISGEYGGIAGRKELSVTITVSE